MTQVTQARAALLHKAGGRFSIEPVQIEAPRPTEILVRMAGSGICHTDLVFRDGGGLALPTPCVLGHEGAGIVEAVGDRVGGLAPGDHVVLTYDSCGTCPTCRRAHPAYCDNLGAHNYGGGRPEDGSSPISQDGARVYAAFFNQSSFATHAIADQRNTVKIPKDVPLDIMGPLGCGVQTGAGAVILSLGMKQGDSLAIFGGGAVGLSALLGALSVGAGPVVVIEPKPGRRALALELGALAAIDPAAALDVAAEIGRAVPGGVTHALDTTGIPDVLAAAADCLANKGVLGVAGLPPLTATLPVSILGLMSRGLTITGIVEGDSIPATFIPHLVGLYREGRFPFDRLVKRFAFDDINEAVAASISGEAIKPVLVFN